MASLRESQDFFESTQAWGWYPKLQQYVSQLHDYTHDDHYLTRLKFNSLPTTPHTLPQKHTSIIHIERLPILRVFRACSGSPRTMMKPHFKEKSGSTNHMHSRSLTHPRVYENTQYGRKHILISGLCTSQLHMVFLGVWVVNWGYSQGEARGTPLYHTQGTIPIYLRKLALFLLEGLGYVGVTWRGRQ